MATMDMTHRKLQFPPRFVPYLEKHRIFELFHECIELLVQFKPRDHIQFLKSVLPCAFQKKDKQRIVFLSPPSFDRLKFAESLAHCLDIQIIQRTDIEDVMKKRFQEKEGEEEEEGRRVCEEEGESCRFIEAEYEQEETIAYPPFVYPMEEERSGEEEEEESKSEPCICVCPCVAKDTEEKPPEKEVEEEQEVGEEDQEEEEEEEHEKGDGQIITEEPCVHSKPRKSIPIFELLVPTDVLTLCSTEIDYSVLINCELSSKGWISVDIGETIEETRKLCKTGVLPTHAIRIIVDEEKEMKNREYKKLVTEWMDIYKFVPAVEIRMGDRDMEQLTRDVCKLVSLMPHRHAPMLPRIVLIGSRGSGVTTQGDKLAKKYGLVHVEFEIVMAKALQQDDEIAKMYEKQLATRPDPELEAYILEKALLTSMCRNRGWVLTGYPRNIDDMRMLDIIATPPNRIIFIEVPPRECFVRLYYRKIDPCLGDEYKIPAIEPFGVDSFKTPDMDPEVAARLVSHPKNDKRQVISDIEKYFYEKKAMMEYCGKTAFYVDGDKSVDAVFELIEQVIINPSPPQPPRDPLEINHGIEESYARLKKYRLNSGMYYNNFFLNPPEIVDRLDTTSAFVTKKR